MSAYWMEKPRLVERWGLRLVLVLITFVMLFPFVYVIAISFSSFADVAGGGLLLFPANPTLDAYRYVLSSSVVPRAVGVSVGVTLVGTLVNLFMTVTLAYSLSRRGVPGRTFVLYLVLFTMLFGPGMIPKYLLVRQLGLIDSLWALILPTAVSAFNLIVMRQAFMSIPEEVLESARLDGANDLQILTRITLPLSKAVIAAVGLFYSVAHWNRFFDALLYINDATKWPIQVVLRQYVLQSAQLPVGTEAMDVFATPPPPVTVQMAIVVIATLPILLMYPFLQKYFTKGVLTGAIKG